MIWAVLGCFLLTIAVVLALQYYKRPKFVHSKICPDFEGKMNGKLQFANHRNCNQISSCFEWFGRLNGTDRQKCFDYLTNGPIFDMMLDAMGCEWILFVATASATFDYAFQNNASKLPFDCIQLRNVEWCRSYYAEQRARLLNGDWQDFSPGDMDFCWLMFYATGDLAFADRVHHISQQSFGSNYTTAIIMAARWSYGSHQGSGRLAVQPTNDILATIHSVPM